LLRADPLRSPFSLLLLRLNVVHQVLPPFWCRSCSILELLSICSVVLVLCVSLRPGSLTLFRPQLLLPTLLLYLLLFQFLLLRRLVLLCLMCESFALVLLHWCRSLARRRELSRLWLTMQHSVCQLVGHHLAG
jgi:hypothetical protein